MNLVRLGDRLDDQSIEKRKPRFQTVDNLAKRVFNPILKDTQLADLYIQSAMRTSRTAATDLKVQEDEVFKGLGDYERMLVGKLLQPVRKVLCIVGPLGCGKTTTIRYVVRRLQQRSHDDCDASLSCQGRRLVTVIDFNEKQFRSITDEDRATNVLLDVLCTQLQARIKGQGIIDPKEELGGFWRVEIDRHRNGDTCSSAFARIINWLPHESLTPDSVVDDRELAIRGQILDKLRENKEDYLDYLVRLWGYLIDNCFQGNNGCAFVVFDNIDKASPLVQSTLLSIVRTCARDPGPTFALAVRPETFDRLGMATDIVDTEPHKGPKASQVVVDRLGRFVADPWSYYKPLEGLRREEFLLVKSFLDRIYERIQSEGYRSLAPYLNFLDSASGRSIRLALLTAQQLLQVSETDMQDSELSVYSLIRLSITQGTPQYEARPRSPIANLFHVRGQTTGQLLVKPRILKFLMTSPGKSRTVNEIQQVLGAFGYERTTLIREAINEMMNIYCQLTRSDGFDSYSQREFLLAGMQKITITDIGEGYAKSLLYSVDYVQETMLDSYVPSDRFGLRVGYSYLPDKFLLLEKFLQEVRLADVEETNCFRERLGKRAYLETFGNNLLSLEIIWELYRSLCRIISSVQRPAYSPQRTDRWLSYDEVLDKYKSLILQAGNDNHKVLGIWPQELDELTGLR